jgi:hypothetical protein
MRTTDLAAIDDPAADPFPPQAEPTEAADDGYVTFGADVDLTWLAGLLYFDRRGRWVVAVPRMKATGYSLRVMAKHPKLPEQAVTAAQDWAAGVLRRRDPSIEEWLPATVLTQSGYIPAPVPEHAGTRPARQARDTGGNSPARTVPGTLGRASAVAAAAPGFGRTLRLGVFYAAAFERRLHRYFEHCHPQRQPLSHFGVHDALRWQVAQELDVAMADCELVERHWIHEEDSEHFTLGVEGVLKAAGINPYSTVQQSYRDHNEVAFAVHVLDVAISAGLGAVALITGSPLLVPLIELLRERGVHVVVPRVAVACPDGSGHDTHRIHTEFALVQAASDAPTFEDLFEPGLQRRSRLAYPFHSRERSQAPNLADETDDDPMIMRIGVVSRWEAGVNYGYIVESGTGRAWFAYYRYTPQGAGLPAGTRVTFVGDPHPAPPRHLPLAQQITPIAEADLYAHQHRRVAISDALSWLEASDDDDR